MKEIASVFKNFKFLVLEVIKQVENTLHLLDRPTTEAMRKIESRDDYVDHLKSMIENKSFSFLRKHDQGDLAKQTVTDLRAITTIAQNLERIADHAVNIVGQLEHFSEPTFLKRFPCALLFDEIIAGLRLIVEAFEERDMGKAVRICRAEATLDEMYRSSLRGIIDELESTQEAANLVTAIFVFHYLERMGDSLLNIGEAIMLSRMGEKLKLHQYETIGDLLAVPHGSTKELMESVDYEGIWDTKSGSQIGLIQERRGDTPEDTEVIYKEGDRNKLLQEKENLELWGRIVPGITPRVFKFQEGSYDAAMLIEYLEGRTLQEIALNGDPELIDVALSQMTKTVAEIWTATKKDEQVSAQFVQQLLDRARDILDVHPEFDTEMQEIDGLSCPGFRELLERAVTFDNVLVAPFSVFGHGDFNLDNIIYSAKTKGVHFIDVHRSRQLDYVQDVSVFLVSNFRIPVFEPVVRERLERIMISFAEFSREFATRQGDARYEARLALGLARSFATSTRFELDEAFAAEMMNRALFLLQRLLGHAGLPWEEFRVPDEILIC